MKAVLGIVSLLVALAIMAVVARTQLRGPAVSGAGAVAHRNATLASEASGVQDKVRDDVARALQDGSRRNEAAER